MSSHGIGPVAPRPIESVQPHRRVKERGDEEREPDGRRRDEPEQNEQDEPEDEGGPHLDILI